jgi:hypothetical protein
MQLIRRKQIFFEWFVISLRMISLIFRSPFLGQGANQALQDAFCLAGLIHTYNHVSRRMNFDFMRDEKIQVIKPRSLKTALTVFSYIVAFIYGLSTLRFCYPTRLQRLCSDFEKKRKTHTFFVALASRFFGWVATLGGFVGVHLKRMIYKFLGMTYLFHFIVFSAMKPVV